MNFKLITASLFILLALAGCAAGAVNSPVPSTATLSENVTAPTDKVPRISIEDLLTKINSGSDFLLVDARRDVAEKFKIAHIKGAVAVPPDTITQGKWTPPDDLNREIIFYCSCPNDKTSASAALLLINKGYTNVKALRGGWNAWEAAGYPVESGAD